MISRGDKIAFVVILLLAGCFYFYMRQRPASASGSISQETASSDKKDKKSKKDKDKPTVSALVNILQKWDMPAELTEISGLTSLPEGRFACVQDEEGKIYIFNAQTGKVDKVVPFGKAGDYEGIAVAGDTAYVLRADGNLFEVTNFLGGKPFVREHATHLTAEHDVEGLCYDARHNRLLLAIKGQDPNSDSYKGIYAFDLGRKSLAKEPAYKVLPAEDGTQKKGKVQPSGLIRHPSTNDIYIVDGPSSRLIVLNEDGSSRKNYQLDEKECPQPEGIAFNSSGELFISNEGKNGSGNILKISLSE